MNKRNSNKQTEIEQVTVKSLKPIQEQSEKKITKQKVKPIMHNHVKKNQGVFSN